jgi:hypothetical protein
MNRANRPGETRDHVRKKFCDFVRKPPALPPAASAMKRRSVRATARTNMKHVMPARALALQVNLDANERIRIVKHVELKP